MGSTKCIESSLIGYNNLFDINSAFEYSRKMQVWDVKWAHFEKNLNQRNQKH